MTSTDTYTPADIPVFYRSTGHEFSPVLETTPIRFLEQCKKDTFERDSRVRYLGGPYANDLTVLFREFDEQIEQQLGEGYSLLHGGHPNFMRKVEDERLTHSLNEHDFSFIRRMKKESQTRLLELYRDYYNEGSYGGDLQPGLLTEPVFQGEMKASGCTSACMAMIMTDLLGTEIPHEDLFYIAGERTSRMPAAEEILEMMLTSRFGDTSEHDIETIAFFGMSVDSLARLIEKLTTKMPKAYLALNLESDTLQAAKHGIMHSVVMLGSIDDHFIVNDPKHGRDTLIEKEKFLARWAATCSSGNLVLAKPRNDNLGAPTTT